ncbi:DUF742 domain-containing protein [Streptomyces pathocidini]|uniref:DUF742 domain-containing protein n=1 Tax=Streptomyces pathocidini TaxID=1650571 RepID=A0ABW7UNV8_9ACTN
MTSDLRPGRGGGGAPGGPPLGPPPPAPHPRGPGRPPRHGSHWYDAEAGPLVRPYAMTGGRTESGVGVRLDLIALITVASVIPDPDEARLGPEHRTLLALCRTESQSVAELGAGADLPVGVVRVLLGDLLELGCVTVSRPVPPAQLPDERILREVIDGLRAL